MLFTFFLARLCYEICPVRWSGNHLIKQGKYSASPNSLVAMVPFCKYLPTSVSLLDFAKHCRPLHTDTSREGEEGVLNKCLYGDQYHLTVPWAQLSTHRGRVFFEVIRWQITGVSNDRRLNFIFFQWFISNMLCFCHYGPALLGFWFQTDLGREMSASFFKNTGGRRPFLTMVTLYVQFLCSDWSKFILFIFYLFYYFATHNELQAE